MWVTVGRARQRSVARSAAKNVTVPPRQNVKAAQQNKGAQSVKAAQQNKGAQSIKAGNARAQEHAQRLLAAATTVAGSLGTLGGRILTYGASSTVSQALIAAIIVLFLIYACFGKILGFSGANRKRFLERKIEEFTNMLDRNATKNAAVNHQLYLNYSRGKMTKSNYRQRLNNLREARANRNAGLREKINEYKTSLDSILSEMNGILRAQNATVGIRTAPVTRMIQNTTAAVVAAGPAVKSVTDLVVAVSGASVAMTQALTAREQAKTTAQSVLELAKTNAAVRKAEADARIAEATYGALTKARTQAVKSWSGVVRESAEAAASTVTAVGGMATAVTAARAAMGL